MMILANRLVGIIPFIQEVVADSHYNNYGYSVGADTL